MFFNTQRSVFDSPRSFHPSLKDFLSFLTWHNCRIVPVFICPGQPTVVVHRNAFIWILARPGKADC